MTYWLSGLSVAPRSDDEQLLNAVAPLSTSTATTTPKNTFARRAGRVDWASFRRRKRRCHRGAPQFPHT